MAIRNIGPSQPPAPTTGFSKPPAGMLPKQIGPLPAGVSYTVMDEKLIPPEQRQQLHELGWESGQPIPSSLAGILNPEEMPDEVRKLQAMYASEERIPDVPAGDVRIKTAKLEELPDDRQTAILEALRRDTEMRKQMAREALASAKVQHAADTAKAAEYAGVAAPLRKTLMNTEKIPVDDDRKPKQATAAAAVEPTVEDATEAAAAPSTGLDRKHTQCLRCGFPDDQQDLVVITEDDKLMWQQSLVGEQQFRREFVYYGGKLLVELRALSPEEQDEILACLRRDVDSGLVSRDDGAELHLRYSIAVSLLRYCVGDADYRFRPQLQDWGATPVARVRSAYEAIYVSGPLKSFSVARIVGQSLRSFGDLCAKLETMAYAPDF